MASLMIWDIRGKRVLVTGATSGIGLEGCVQPCQAGRKGRVNCQNSSRGWMKNALRASHGEQCPSYSLCWAPYARRSGPEPTLRSTTWRSGNSLPCSAAVRSDRNSGASIVSSGCCSPTIGLGGERRSISRRYAENREATRSRSARHPTETITAPTRCYTTASPYGWTAGSVVWSPVLMHLGWPKPPVLLPVPPLGLGTMS
jgi:hypothetical protein